LIGSFVRPVFVHKTGFLMAYLSGKVAAIFAAGGAISGAVAKSIAAHGAKVYLSGRDLHVLQALAQTITEAGGQAEVAHVDALHEGEIDAFLQRIVTENGRLDIVFNGIGVRPSESDYGTYSTQISFAQFMKPMQTHVGSQFLTARAAARVMMQTQTQGTILMLTASLSRLKLPFMAGITSACAAIEGLTRNLAGEFGQAGIKVICMNPTSLGETRTIKETNAASARSMGIAPEALAQMLSSQYLLRKSPTLHDVGEVAAFLVSDAGATFNSHIMDVDFGSMSVI
jgi:NAD(P)-dependent dehydrogenase (short-subunit alcohol dehydrogenase family)